MDYKQITTHDITGLSVREISVIQAALVLLANGATYGNNSGYPEYRKDAANMLKVVAPHENSTKPFV